MQESAFTQKELKQMRKPLFQIIKTNRMTNMVKIGKMLVELGFDEKCSFHYNMVYILKYFDIHKLEGYYQHVDPETITDSHDYVECWRCEKNQKFPEFPKGVNELKSRIKICRTCLREENLVTGESIAELVGIYSYLQHRYRHCLEKWMYRRFWEPILG